MNWDSEAVDGKTKWNSRVFTQKAGGHPEVQRNSSRRGGGENPQSKAANQEAKHEGKASHNKTNTRIDKDNMVDR